MSLTDEQKRIRREGIGSSESACIAGIPAFTAPIDVFRSKVEGQERDSSFLMEMGHLTEPANLALLERNTGASVVPGYTWKHPTLPIVDTVDGVATFSQDVLLAGRLQVKAGTTAPVEAKLVLPWNAQEFGEEGTDEVPLPYYAQAQHHLWSRRQQGFQEEFCLMPVLVGVLEWRLYVIPWDPELAETLIGHSLRFWERHVLTKVAPPVDGSRSYAQYLAEKYPQPQSIVLPATAEAEQAAADYLKAKEVMDQAEKFMTEAANRLRLATGDAEGLKGNGWDASWKANKNGVRTLKVTAWKTKARRAA